MDFVRNGGTLITLDSSSELVLDNFDLPVKNPLRPEDEEKESDNGQENRFFCPGSLLWIHLDTTDPLAYGMPEETAIFFSHSPAFAWEEPADGEDESTDEMKKLMVGEYPGVNPLLSGWILNDDQLHGQGALARISLGSGSVVMFGFKPQYRASSWGTFKLLFNSIYNAATR